MKRFFATLLILSGNIISQSQNLIPNSSFENFSICPDAIKQIARAKDWYSANAGSPEYFNNCGFIEQIQPYDGEGMAGLIFLDDYRSMVEYIQVELLEPLNENEEYDFQFYVASSPLNPIITDKIGAYFSKDEMKTPLWEPFIKSPQVYLNDFIDENGKWTKVSGTFKAKGGEKFMTVGNFFEAYYLKEKRTFKNTQQVYTYYYFDSFSLSPKNQKLIVENEIFPQKLEEIRHTVLFDSDDYNIKEKEREELKCFLKSIDDQISNQLKVEAHTDTNGSFSYNLLLSQERAKSVVNFIDSFSNLPTYSIWFGESQPLINDGFNSKNQDAKNRRVTITLVE